MHGIMLWDEDDSRLLSESNQVTGVTPLGVTLVFLSALASCWGVFLQKIAQKFALTSRARNRAASHRVFRLPLTDRDTCALSSVVQPRPRPA